jgi:hypothetical protein
VGACRFPPRRIAHVSQFGRHDGMVFQFGKSLMRIFLGWLTFLLAVAFAACLVAALILNSWFGFANGRTVLGFFGFGIPTVVIGGATAALWDGHKSLQKLLGWAGTMAGIVCAVAVLLLVAGLVLSERPEPVVGATIGRFLGFGVTALICGAFGIALLFEAEGKSF